MIFKIYELIQTKQQIQWDLIIWPTKIELFKS